MTEFTIPGAIILQLVYTFYYIYFIIRPLSEIEKISGKTNYGYRLFIIRTIIVMILDFIDPTLSSFLDTALLITLAFVIVPSIKQEKNYLHKIETELAKYDELTDEELATHGIKDRKIIEDNLFKLLVEVQTARTNYDFDTLKYLCTSKLYSLYESELHMLKEAELGYHFEQYQKIEAQIFSITTTDKDVILKIAIKASCYDYRLDAEKQLVDGSNEYKTMKVHELEFRKPVNDDNIDLNCPNCGAPTKRSTKGRCQYCNTIIHTLNSNWTLSENKIVAEKITKK